MTRMLRARMALIVGALALWPLTPGQCEAQPTTAPAVPGSRPPSSPASWREVEQRWRDTSDEALKKLAESGDAQAQYAYGLHGAQRALQDLNRAFRWQFASVANGKNLTSAEQSASRAKWASASATDLRKAAEAGDRGAQWFLGTQGSEQAVLRAQAAFAWAERAAQQGLPCAEFDLGINYLGASGYRYVTPEFARGLDWLQRSADHGFEPARHQLALLYLEGDVVPPDLQKGIDYLRRAVDEGCSQACYDLAQRYAQGDGEPRNAAEAPLPLLRKAADAGSVPAQVALATRYRWGVGTHKDFLRAIQLYQRAVGRGRVAAQRLHALVIDSSFNPPILTDSDDAAPAYAALAVLEPSLEPKPALDGPTYRFAAVLGTYRKATERADVQAMKTLGDLYLQGELVPEEPVQALAWYGLAAARGSAPAAAAMKEWQSRLSAVESNAALKRQEELVKLCQQRAATTPPPGTLSPGAGRSR